MKPKAISYSKHNIDSYDVMQVLKALKSPAITQGPKVEEFEKKLSKVTNSKYAVAVNSGTAALHISCLAIDLKKDDEVITSPLSFAATSNCVLYCQATVVFADIDESGLLSPKEVVKNITKKTKAIITVDYGGFPSHINELKEICKKYNLFLIEDAAHSLGAFYYDKPIGSLADLTCFSFHPVKTITTGEGGAVSTNNLRFYKKMLLYRSHGITKKRGEFVKPYEGQWQQEMQLLGYNYRITDIQAALGISQLRKIKTFINCREKIAYYYNNQFKNLEKKGLLQFPKFSPFKTSAWHLYPLRINFERIKYSKKKLFAYFQENGIRLQVHYPPIHTHPYYSKNLGFRKGDFPHSEQFYSQEVSLPLYPTLTSSQMKKVVQLINKYIVK